MASARRVRRNYSEQRLIAEVWDKETKLAEIDITNWSLERVKEFYRVAEIQESRVQLRREE